MHKNSNVVIPLVGTRLLSGNVVPPIAGGRLLGTRCHDILCEDQVCCGVFHIS